MLRSSATKRKKSTIQGKRGCSKTKELLQILAMHLGNGFKQKNAPMLKNKGTTPLTRRKSGESERGLFGFVEN